MRNVALVVAVPMFVLALLGGLFQSQLCVPCAAVLGGLAAGYWVNRRLEAETSQLAAQQGAKAGALAGIGALLGHLAGGLAAGANLGPEGAVRQVAPILEALNLPQTANPSLLTFYGTITLASCCFGVFDVAVMAAMGALAGVVGYQIGKHSQGQAPLPPAV